MAKEQAGDVARQMAGNQPTQVEREQVKGIANNPLAKQFSLVSFKLPPKREIFTNDDGTKTQRLAFAVLRLIPSGIEFRASVYRSEVPGSGEESIYLSMPSSGKGFPRPIFTAEHDPQLQEAYDLWRYQMAEEYEKWAEKNLSKPSAMSSAVRLVRKVPVPTVG